MTDANFTPTVTYHCKRLNDSALGFENVLRNLRLDYHYTRTGTENGRTVVILTRPTPPVREASRNEDEFQKAMRAYEDECAHRAPSWARAQTFLATVAGSPELPKGVEIDVERIAISGPDAASIVAATGKLTSLASEWMAEQAPAAQEPPRRSWTRTAVNQPSAGEIVK
jgi:hypothetical protein